MRIVRDPQIITGFIYEEPVDELPALTHCGDALCCQGHKRPLHAHPGFEFLYLSRGICHWQAAATTYCQSMGSMFIAYPYETHSTGLRLNPENRHLWVGLHLNKLGLEGMRLANEIKEKKIHLLSGCEEAEPLLHSIIAQVVELRPHRTDVITALLNAFVALMLQRLSLNASSCELPRTKSVLPYSSTVHQAITYMKRNLNRHLQLREVAAVSTAGSVSHFCTQFRREVGLTPSHYHLQLRLEAARETLRHPSADITVAAMEFGFSSSQHFSTLFRRAFGVTPRQWKVHDGASCVQDSWPSATVSCPQVRGRTG